MNQQSEFINDAFHVLAQPIMALRATVELGLDAAPQDSRRALDDCLHLIDQLMQDMAVFREIASLDEALPLESHAGDALLQSCVEEMTPVARECGVLLHLAAEAAAIECHEATFRRAMFVLLDELIASMPRGGEVWLALRSEEAGVRLEVRPGTRRGTRQKLCWKLLQYAGGSLKCSADGSTSAVFPKSRGRHSGAIPLAD
jgi:signal transduction histidine kinase